MCDNPNNWSKNQCYVTYVINTSVSESTKPSPFSLIYGTEATSVLDLYLAEVPDNVHKTIEHAYKYWFDNLTLLCKLARENMICSKQNTRYNMIVIHVHIILEWEIKYSLKFID